MSTGSNEVTEAEKHGSKLTRRPPIKVFIVAATVANAAGVLSVQILGLLTLAPSDFGLFSVQYLFFALASSICLSVVCEPWLRKDLHDGQSSTWHEYSSILIYLSTLGGVVTLVVSLAVPALQVIAISGSIAVLASTYRTGARYHEVRSRNWMRVLYSDVAGLVVTIGTWIALSLAGENSIWSVSVAWAAGSVASAILSASPRILGPRSLSIWFTRHRTHITPLLRDSTLMDLGAIGTPLVLAPMLGIASFGVYRAVSNVAAPVRLLLNPLRPSLAGAPLSMHLSRQRVLGSACLSISTGLAAYVALIWIDTLSLALGSLTAVAAYAFPTALFVSANFLGHYYYIIARAHRQGIHLLVGRIVQTCLAILLPVGGVVVLGLSGAIWGYAVATMVSALTWLTLVVNSRLR